MLDLEAVTPIVVSSKLLFLKRAETIIRNTQAQWAEDHPIPPPVTSPQPRRVLKLLGNRTRKGCGPCSIPSQRAAECLS